MRHFSEKHAPAMSISAARAIGRTWPLRRNFIGLKVFSFAIEEVAADPRLACALKMHQQTILRRRELGHRHALPGRKPRLCRLFVERAADVFMQSSLKQ
jgi:hypothetical protein